MLGADKLRIVLRSHGLKRENYGLIGCHVLPKADLYVDCRAVQEHGIDGGIGEDPTFQQNVAKSSPEAINSILALVVDALRCIPARRLGDSDPYAKPFEVLFFCAWGVHRSPAVKAITGRRLQALGYNVKVV